MPDKIRRVGGVISLRVLFLYSGLAFLFLVMPLLQSFGSWASPVRRYATLSATINCFHTYAIYEDKGDIDILFSGGSRLWSAINIPELKAIAEKKLKRPLSIVMLGSGGYTPTFDLVKVADILKSRRVKMLVLQLTAPFGDDNFPHYLSSGWLRFQDWPSITPGLSFAEKAKVYAAMVLGSPFLLFDRVTPLKTLPCEEIIRRGGARNQEEGFEKSPFVPFMAQSPNLSAAEMLFGHSGQRKYRSSVPPLENFQSVILEKLGKFTKSQSLKLVHVDVPVLHEHGRAWPQFEVDWAKYVGDHLTMVAVAPKRLFANVDQTQLKHLFRDAGHFNVNGGTLFTQTIAPALLEIYENAP